MMSLRELAQTLLGLVLAVTPLAMWVAWTPALLAGVLAVALLSAGLLVLLTDALPARTPDVRARLSEEFLEEVQHLHPMIYHHSGRRSSRFHRTMRRLARRSGH